MPRSARKTNEVNDCCGKRELVANLLDKGPTKPPHDLKHAF